jgi:hypothetical protein
MAGSARVGLPDSALDQSRDPVQGRGQQLGPEVSISSTDIDIPSGVRPIPTP